MSYRERLTDQLSERGWADEHVEEFLRAISQKTLMSTIEVITVLEELDRCDTQAQSEYEQLRFDGV